MKKHLFKSILFSSLLLATISGGYVYAESSSDSLVADTVVVESAEDMITGETSDNLLEAEVTTEVAENIPESESQGERATASESEHESVLPTEVEISVEQYRQNVSEIDKVSITDVYQAFMEDGKEHTIYVGRETCYYCRQFSPVLKEFNELTESRLAYYDTENGDFDDEAKKFLFETVGIPGTPTILYLKNGQLTSGWVGGGISASNLYDYLYLGKSLEEIMKEEEKMEELPSEKAAVPQETSTETKVNAIVTSDAVPLEKVDKNVENLRLSNGVIIEPINLAKTNQEEMGEIVKKLSVTKGTQVATLPKTGEKNSLLIMLVGFSIMLLALGLVNINKERKNQ
ncbi:LPXTG cell wall anchor domain-containing protein [Streptococcus suis]|nr:LPXTG cell wall anchor domain-containing protein [Streptococcus suis]